LWAKISDQIHALWKNQVVKNLILVGTITLLMKGIGFFKETMVAGYFGLSEILDTFFIAFLVPGFISNVFLGAFKNVFIPNYIAERKTGNNIASFQGTGFMITGLVSLLFMLLAYLTTDVYLENLFPGHSAAYYHLITVQLYYLLPCIFFWGFSSLISGLLYINDEFMYSSFTDMFIPIVIIVSLSFFREDLGDNVLAIGTLVGSLLGLLYLVLVSSYKNILKIALPNLKNKNARLMFSQMPAKVSSGLLTGLNSIVDQFFAAQLIVGSIAAINYGLKIPAFLSGLVVIALTNVLLPHFSKSILEDRKKTFEVLFKILKTIFWSTCFFALIGIIFSDYLVELLFERKEFTSENTIIVSNIQKIFLIYVPFSIAGMVMVNFLTSINKNVIMAYISLGAVILNIILDYILMQYYGVIGIALCTTIVVILKNSILLYYILKVHGEDKLQIS
jgi:putative peptidoglycan lipid II flippase